MKAKKYNEILRELRGSTSRSAVAEAVGVTRSAIGMYEQGVRVPRDNIKKKLASYYGKSIEEIFYSH